MSFFETKHEKVIKHTTNPSYVLQKFKQIYGNEKYTLQISPNIHYKYRIIMNENHNDYIDFGPSYIQDYSYHRNEDLKYIYESYHILDKYRNKWSREYMEYYLLN
jgi:hypothetical protein